MRCVPGLKQDPGDGADEVTRSCLNARPCVSPGTGSQVSPRPTVDVGEDAQRVCATGSQKHTWLIGERGRLDSN